VSGGKYFDTDNGDQSDKYYRDDQFDMAKASLVRLGE